MTNTTNPDPYDRAAQALLDALDAAEAALILLCNLKADGLGDAQDVNLDAGLEAIEMLLHAGLGAQ